MQETMKAAALVALGLGSVAAGATTHTLPLVLHASNPALQGFVRVLNQSDRAGTVSIRAFDDDGREFGPVTLSLGAGAAHHFNSTDLERGNPDKGLSGGVGDGSGHWRLELSTTLDIQPLAYVRTSDGFVTSMHDVVAAGDVGAYFVRFFNPGSNRNQMSMLRIVNPDDDEVSVTIEGTDDRGGRSAGAFRLSVPGFGARQVNALELEASGLGDGGGKWRLRVTTDHPVLVMNLLRSPSGHLANLSTVPTLMIAGDYNGITPSFHQPRDGISAANMANYFRVFLGGMEDSKSQYREPGFARFPSPPIIRMMGGGTNPQRALLHHAVGLINRELPQHLHLRIGSDAPHIGHVADTHGGANTESIPNGQMFIYFSDSKSAGFPDGVEGGGFANTRFTYDRSQIPWVKQSLEASFVWVNDGTMPEQQRLGILLHEMLHALGFYAHLYSEEFPSSILGPMGPKGGFHQQWGSQLPEIDGTALRAAHRLPNGITPDRFNILLFGDWETTYTEIFGSISTNDSQPLRFGANLTNDVAVPWTSGVIPSTEFADSPAFSGSARWQGALFGFTPAEDAIAGDVSMRISPDSMTGTIVVSGIESWGAGTAPGARGSGTTWNYDELRYKIAVDGNFIRTTGGDDGALFGQFYGSSHSGVAISIERSDFIATFGGIRK